MRTLVALPGRGAAKRSLASKILSAVIANIIEAGGSPQYNALHSPNLHWLLVTAHATKETGKPVLSLCFTIAASAVTFFLSRTLSSDRMQQAFASTPFATDGLTDEQVIERVLSGDTALYELIMRRYNQRLYRVVRSILRDEDEVEDVMQDAYVRAYKHLADFAGRSQFSTWLTRIAVHEALARHRRGKRLQPLDDVFTNGGPEMLPADTLDPEQHTSAGELAGLLEQAILGLPANLRTVVVLRDVEELSTSETAAALSLSEENVKARLHRGRALLRKSLYAQVGPNARNAFMFMGARCDRVVQRVLKTLANSSAEGFIQ